MYWSDGQAPEPIYDTYEDFDTKSHVKQLGLVLAGFMGALAIPQLLFDEDELPGEKFAENELYNTTGLRPVRRKFVVEL